MKKLMIAAAVAMLGIAANAAATEWGVSLGVFNLDDWTTPAAGTVAIMYGGDVKDSGSLVAGEYNSTVAGDTTTNMKAGEQWTIRFTTTFDGLGAYYYDAIVTMPSLSGDPTLDGQKWAQINGDATSEITEVGYGAIPTSITKEELTAAGWTAAAVPEPTSGLLLLLGVAGLALKRRRA